MTARESLNGAGFVEMIRAGHHRLQKNVDLVNSLNIFPVPDGDTGTNMSLSLGAGMRALDANRQWTLAEAAQALTSGLLMGARGNSGVILSQLFRGFSKVVQQQSELDVATFAKALADGVQIAYQAVAKPVEGTILSVAKEAATVGVKQVRKHHSLADWLSLVVEGAQAALERTPEQLAVLKQAGVVDSGGQGLVFILSGFLSYVAGEDSVTDVDEAAVQSPAMPPKDLDFAAAHIDHEGEYGYCTEILVRVETGSTDAAVDSLRSQLSEYGDSLLVVGASDLVKVHVHTLQPGQVLQDGLAFGQLVSVKVDNMTEQHADIHDRAHAESHSIEMPSQHSVPDVAVVAVAAGDGLSEIFSSLGVHVVISGGQTMNPSTEEIVHAIQSIGAPRTIVLPNNKNIVMAAEQAVAVLGDEVKVVATTTIPQGIAAMMAYHQGMDIDENVRRMMDAINDIESGQVVRAVRDSVYQGQHIREGQYLGFVNQELVAVGEGRNQIAMQVVSNMNAEDAELMTLFFGEEVSEDVVAEFQDMVYDKFGIEVEARSGGQPVYDYIFSLE